MEGITVTVPAGEQLEMDIAVYRGPEEYVYDPIEIEIMPPCEVDIADAKDSPLGINELFSGPETMSTSAANVSPSINLLLILLTPDESYFT